MFKELKENMFKELKETMSKELEEIRLVSHQIETISIETTYRKEPNRNSRVEKYNN